MVNDTAYVDPACFNNTYSGLNLPFNNIILNLNTTLQSGSRTFGNPSKIGGNFWAYPNGTGPSQTGVDVNHDGFIDTAFNILGSFNNASLGAVYDYLPYSQNYATSLAFTVGGSQSLAINQTSSIVTVELQDAYGALTSGVTFNLASNSTTAKFYSDSEGVHQIASLTNPAGISTASFYFKDTTVGTAAITVSSSDATSATTNFAVNAHSQTVDHITINPQSNSIPSGESLNFTTIAFDAFGNSWDVTDNSTYFLNGALLNGNTLTATLVGDFIVSSIYDNNVAHTTLTVTAGLLDHFSITSPAAFTSGIPFEITITANDAAGNVVTSFNGTVTLSSSQGVISPTVSGIFTNGVLTCTVTLTGSSPATIAVDDGSNHTGTSTTLTSTLIPYQTIQATKGNGETLNLAINGNITSSQFSTITLTSSQSTATTTLSFTLQGTSGDSGFTNITISKSQIPYGSEPIVYIDDIAAQNQGFTEDSQNYYVWFTVSFSTHQIDVTFTGQPTTTQDYTIWYLLVAVALLIAVAALAVVWKKQKQHKTPMV
jgi:hypothetical protein